MGILETELRELRFLLHQYNERKITDKDVRMQLAIYNQTHKRVSLLLQAIGMGVKHGKAISSRLIEINILGNEAPIKIEEESPINPCLSCDLGNKDKNNPRCSACAKRTEYIKLIA